MIEDFLEDNITQANIKVVGIGNGGLKVLEYLSFYLPNLNGALINDIGFIVIYQSFFYQVGSTII